MSSPSSSCKTCRGQLSNSNGTSLHFCECIVDLDSSLVREKYGDFIEAPSASIGTGKKVVMRMFMNFVTLCCYGPNQP